MSTTTNGGPDGGSWEHSGGYGDYDGFGHQCSSYVCDALVAGNLKTFKVLRSLGTESFFNKGPRAISPNALSDYARIAGGKIIYPAVGNPKRD